MDLPASKDWLTGRSVISAAPLVIAGALAVAAAAQLSFPIPGTDIPQTGQTVAVLLAGSIGGPIAGTIAILLYLLLGLAGLPVFSEGASGWVALSGSSAGYFIGFVLAAALCGLLLKSSQHKAHPSIICGVMVLGHGIILLCGWAWLARNLGAAAAFSQGIAPFLYGGLIKSLLAAGLLWLLATLRDWQWR